MPCYHPRPAFLSKNKHEGKHRLSFNPGKGFEAVLLPCRKCLGCRLDYSQQWSVRLMHENQMHKHSMFLTLTYDEHHLPEGATLVKKHFQDFMKRYRKSIAPGQIRFFQCGEYGDKNKRPHYHAIIFGHRFTDQVLQSENKDGDPLYRSETLNKLWGLGFCWIGAVTAQSAAYVARYVVKKVHEDHEQYVRWDSVTGEIFNVTPEYITMSRAEGLGRSWFDKFKTDLYPDDFALVEGKKTRVPRFYDQLLAKEDADKFDNIKKSRRERGFKTSDNNTTTRLRIRESLRKIKTQSLKRQ